MTARGKVIGYFPSMVKQREKTRLMKLLDVTRAKDDSHRLEKLQLAVEALDHHDRQKHDDDIKAGAVQIICSILRSCSPFFIAKSELVKCCCTILLQLYRCSQDRARASFCTDGFTLLTNLLEVIEINYRLGKLGDPKCLLLANDVIYKLLDVSKVPLTMVKNKDEFVSSLVSNINGCTGKYVMQLSLKSIASLSEHAENKQVLLGVKDLLGAVEVGSRHMDRAVRVEAARILLNLAWEPKNKSKLLQSSIGTILALVAGDGGSVTSQSYALQTLTHLATDTNNKINLVDHNNGTVISTLVHIASSDTSQASMSIDATKIIGYLTCRATAWNIASVPGVCTTLSSLACRSDDLAQLAAKAIHKMATYVHYHPKTKRQDFKTVHAFMLQAIVTISYGTSTDVLKYAVKAYSEQASFRRDRIQIIGHKGLLSALSVLTHDENNFVSECAKEILGTLACDELRQGIQVWRSCYVAYPRRKTKIKFSNRVAIPLQVSWMSFISMQTFNLVVNLAF
eukprot:scaffold449_cov158-Skeletonema_marinoi.AAC.2